MGVRDLMRIKGELEAIRPVSPATADAEAAFRAWCKRRLDVLLADVASMSPEDKDDKLSATLAKIVEDDATWNLAYPLVCGVADPAHRPVPITLEASDAVDAAAGVGSPDHTWCILTALAAGVRMATTDS